MGKHKITDLFLYRYRYYIGYGGLVVLFGILLVFAALYVPGGLSQNEMAGVVRGSQIDLHHPSTLAIPSAPYYIGQQKIIAHLGISNFSIKLLSLACAFLTSVGAFFLLRRWFRPNVAMLTTAIMVTTGQFLFIAQQGTSGITTIMWSVWLLLAASMVTASPRYSRFWNLVFFVVAGVSLYTSLSLYLLLAIISAALLHPHVRYVLKRISALRLIGLMILFGLLLAPLAYLVSLKPSFGMQLLGLPTAWPPDLIANLRLLGQEYFGFVGGSYNTMVTPVYSLGAIILMFVGAWQLFKTRYTARSYTLTAWLILIIPIVVISPSYTPILFVPLLLLLANGLDYLFRSWYRLFPRNPYARIAGLIPLVVLVGGLLVSGIDRYIYGYHYSPQVVQRFSRDLTLFNYQVKDPKSTTLLVTDSEKPFYDVVAAHTPGLTVTTTVPPGNFAATHDANGRVGFIPTRIVVTGLKDSSDRFYIYKNAAE